MYIVTGAAGFIGSCVVSKLNAEGIEDILCVDQLGSSDRWKNLRGKLFSDYLHKDKFRGLITSGSPNFKVKAVIHMGACSSTTESDSDFMLDNNYRYSRELAEWCLNERVRFIYASSAATYGDGQLGYDDSDEVSLKLTPLNVYGYSKQLLDTWAIKTGASKKIAGLKFFNVFGPNEYYKDEMRSVVLKSFLQIQSGESVKLFKSYKSGFKNGEQSRDFIYVKDCVDVVWWLIKNKDTNGIFNLGSGKARTWLDLARAVYAALGKKESIEFIEMPENLRPQYQYFTEAKMEKLKASGYDLKFHSLEDGIKDYVQNYLVKGMAAY